MQISNASEIQFWPTGEDSFNTEEEGYTDDYCFHQKFLCTGQRRFQGADEDGTIRDYFLIGFDEDGEIVFNEQYDAEQAYPGNPANIFTPYPFTGWTNEAYYPIGANPWTIAAEPFADTGLSLIRTDYLVSPIFVQEQTFDIDITVTVETAAGKLHVEFYKEGVLIGSQETDVLGVGADQEITLSVDLTDNADECKFQIERTTGLSCKMTIKAVSTNVAVVAAAPVVYSLSMTPSDESMCDKKIQFKIFDGPDPDTDEELYYSDFIDFVSEWTNSPGSGRIDIQFKSVQNFAGLFYTEDSDYFMIQLDGRFRKERQVTAQKSLELTEVVLNTAQSVKTQRRLTIDDVPDYMHKKINLILAHASSGSVYIKGKEWSVEETYEEAERPGSYPMSPAEIWLTEKLSYQHNVI